MNHSASRQVTSLNDAEGMILRVGQGRLMEIQMEHLAMGDG